MRCAGSLRREGVLHGRARRVRAYGHDWFHPDRVYPHQKVRVCVSNFICFTDQTVRRWAQANIRKGQGGVEAKDVYGSRV